MTCVIQRPSKGPIILSEDESSPLQKISILAPGPVPALANTKIVLYYDSQIYNDRNRGLISLEYRHQIALVEVGDHQINVPATIWVA